MRDPPASLDETLQGVLHRFRHAVHSLGGRHGLTGDLLDELEQEVRIRLWRAAERGEKIGQLPASYIRKAAASAATDLIRRRRARRMDRKVGIDAAEISGELSPVGRTPAHHLEAKALGQAIDAALETLSETREPVVRMYLAGYSREEIAELMQWTEARTRNLLYRGLADLRAELERRGVSPG